MTTGIRSVMLKDGKGKWMTRTRKFLRPIINWTVERFFPDCLFYGTDLPTKWGADSPMRGMVAETSALSLAVQCDLAGAGGMTVYITGATYKGKSLGDWRVKIEKVLV